MMNLINMTNEGIIFKKRYIERDRVQQPILARIQIYLDNKFQITGDLPMMMKLLRVYVVYRNAYITYVELKKG